MQPKTWNLFPAAAQAGNVHEEAKVVLQKSPHPEFKDIRCSYAEGVLTMEGTVSNYFLWHTAQALCQGLRGVESIDNRLTVNSTSSAWLARRQRRTASRRG